MKKIIIGLAVVVVAGLAYWLISPFFIDKKVSEALPYEGGSSLQVVSAGSFAGFDRIHTGSGDVSLLKTEEGFLIRFEENFDVANGPDLYVGLGKDGQYIKGSEVARLKGNQGSQNYILPKDFDQSEFSEIWIWCKAFGVGFAKAELKTL